MLFIERLQTGGGTNVALIFFPFQLQMIAVFPFQTISTSKVHAIFDLDHTLASLVPMRLTDANMSAREYMVASGPMLS